MTDRAGTSTRIRCTGCGTEQEAPDGTGEARCLICGGALGGETSRTRAASLAVPESGAAEVFAVSDGQTPQDAVDLPEEAPVRRPEEVDQLLALERRTTALLALIPLWGTWRIWTSESHGLFERIVLAGLSLLVTGAFAIAVLETIPDEEDRTALAADRVAGDLETIEELLQRYRTQYGKWPDEETWAESIRRGDPRFQDPWGRPYRYTPLGDDGIPVVSTLGRDGTSGGTGADQDVSRPLRENRP